MKVLIIEDDKRIAKLIKKGLEELDFEVTLAYDGLGGLALSQEYDFKLIITDIILPKLDGLELCKLIRQNKPETPIIMLTALGTTDDKVEGFDAGADDYLVKPFEMRELVVRINALMKRYSHSASDPDAVLSYGGLEMNLHSKIVKRNGKGINLTPKEFKLLEFLLKNSERVLDRVEIAEQVWETHFDRGTNFIDVYINYLRKKIDKDFDIKLIHTKKGMGFILKKDE